MLPSALGQRPDSCSSCGNNEVDTGQPVQVPGPQRSRESLDTVLSNNVGLLKFTQAAALMSRKSQIKHKISALNESNDVRPKRTLQQKVVDLKSTPHSDNAQAKTQTNTQLQRLKKLLPLKPDSSSISQPASVTAEPETERDYQPISPSHLQADIQPQQTSQRAKVPPGHEVACGVFYFAYLVTCTGASVRGTKLAPFVPVCLVISILIIVLDGASTSIFRRRKGCQQNSCCSRTSHSRKARELFAN